jgi:predicted  nucleic acid-binding Zn-ribbon protein
VQKTLQKLVDLQSFDAQLNEIRAKLATFPKKLAEIEARVTAAKADVDQTKAAQLQSLKDRKKYELDVDQHKDRVRKYRDQTSQVKTNEAYKALQHEVQMAEEEIAKAEDRLLEQMVAGEAYDVHIKAAEKLLKEVEEIARNQRAKIQADKAEAETRLAELTTERTSVIADIPENILDNYDRIAKKHGGIAVAEIRDEKCSACGMKLRPHMFQEMQRRDNEEMYHCETCTRIIYYPDQPRIAASAATPDDQPAQ